ncbi:MAG: hypothetical protein H6655_22370 [Ardenticatenaceae bacterium]|nr:hypothetical protein [Ardenticatenaceae bacterium]
MSKPGKKFGKSSKVNNEPSRCLRHQLFDKLCAYHRGHHEPDCFAWRTEEFALITSLQTRAELNEVLDRPKIRALAKEPIERLQREVAKFSLFVDGADQISGVCRDPNDDKFFGVCRGRQSALFG